MLKLLSLSFALLLVAASSVRAEICTQISLAEILEADITNPAPSTPTADQRTLRALDLNAKAMADVYVNDPRLVAAVADYVARFEQDQISVANHTIPAHRASLRNMVIASYDFCDSGAEQVSFVPQASDAPNGGLSARDAISWGITNGLRFLAAITIAVIAYFIFKSVQTRRKRSQRHLCFVDVDITSTAGTFVTKMVDISAVGAKIRLPEGVKLPSKGTLSFNGTTHPANFIWQNRHFAGLRFNRPLRGRTVLAIADSKQERSGRKLRSA